jgi:hypothetical protein
MADTTGSSATDRELEVMCLTVQRLLRVAISDWYGYLARQALTDWKWRYEVPWWVKKVPERFDKDWALNDLRAAVDRPGMVASLMTAVDETHLSIEREREKLDHPPNIDKLRDVMERLCASLGGYDVLGV